MARKVMGVPGAWVLIAILAAAVQTGCYDTGPLMRPGENCLGCHDGGGRAPRFRLAGTVFECGTAEKHEGVAGVEVIVSDPAGAEVLRLTTNEAGNFYTRTSPPEGYRVRLERGATVREMPGTPPRGGCASCHTLPPENGTRGRLYIGTPTCDEPPRDAQEG